MNHEFMADNPPYSHIEQLSEPALIQHFEQLSHEIPLGSQTVEVDAELLKKVIDLSHTPFNEIESAQVLRTAAYYDADDATTYPDTISVMVRGWYGDIDVNERTLTYVIANQTDGQPARGFVVQDFHDQRSYELQYDHSPHGIAVGQSIAGHYDAFRSILAKEPQIEGMGDSGDFKRTHELWPIDYDDLELVVRLIDSRQTS